MSRALSQTLLGELHGQESSDPFLVLITLTGSFGNLYYVNNVEDIVSRGNTYVAFPLRMTMPVDDGESIRSVSLEFDNVSLELIDEIRSATDFIEVTIELVLASNPDNVEIELGELKIKNVTYNATTVKCDLFMDDFLNTELTSEKYAPSNFPGIFS